jgi:hypothetical protein
MTRWSPASCGGLFHDERTHDHGWLLIPTGPRAGLEVPGAAVDV